jgi:hypothetical protein
MAEPLRHAVISSMEPRPAAMPQTRNVLFHAKMISHKSSGYRIEPDGRSKDWTKATIVYKS